MDDIWDDPELKKWLESAGRDMLPKMKNSAISIAIFGDTVDPKLCLEIGAAILYDKPIVLLVIENENVPPALERVAAAIVRGSINDPEVQAKFEAAILRVLPHRV